MRRPGRLRHLPGSRWVWRAFCGWRCASALAGSASMWWMG